MKGIKKITAFILATIFMFTAGITAFAEGDSTEQLVKKEEVLTNGGTISTEAYKADTKEESKLWEGLSNEFTDEKGVKWVYLNKKNYIVSENNPNYLYRLDEDGNVAIAYNYYGDKAYDEIIVPSTIDGHTVTKIDAFAFYLCNRVSGIRIPDTVKEVGYYAFGYCMKLERIVIGSGVEKFSADALVGTNMELEFCFTGTEEQANAITVWSYKKLYAKKSFDWSKFNGECVVVYGVNTEELVETSRISELSLFEMFIQHMKNILEKFKNFLQPCLKNKVFNFIYETDCFAISLPD